MSTDETEKPHRETRKRPIWITWEWETATAVGTIVIALATIITATVAWVQWKELRKTNEIYEKQTEIAAQALSVSATLSKSVGRAYIIWKCECNEEGAVIGGKIAQYKVVNAGSTPAYITSIYAISAIADPHSAQYELTKKILSYHGHDTEYFTAGLIRSYDASENNGTDNELLSRYGDGKKQHYLLGRITYKDIYHDDHQTSFCIYADASMIKQGVMEMCDFFNSVD